ncbi:hypothetical protein [Desulfonatronospira sp.]|uniref:hypothetical protein n=1 Tax=Desulfonatronospira sp. TaxID=1962951 RepID=UPI0025B8B702|nr:hypothetical protein [Desulfonatronospira sp.]
MTMSLSIPGCYSLTGLFTLDLDCSACPDYECSLRFSNGFFSTDVTLVGPQNSPPFLARLYYRKNKIGRFLIQLPQRVDKGRITISGKANLRYSDILEWNHKGLRALGWVNPHGEILNLKMSMPAEDFQNSLTKYLQTKNPEYIASLLGNRIQGKMLG